MDSRFLFWRRLSALTVVVGALMTFAATFVDVASVTSTCTSGLIPGDCAGGLATSSTTEIFQWNAVAIQNTIGSYGRGGAPTLFLAAAVAALAWIVLLIRASASRGLKFATAGAVAVIAIGALASNLRNLSRFDGDYRSWACLPSESCSATHLAGVRWSVVSVVVLVASMGFALVVQYVVDNHRDLELDAVAAKVAREMGGPEVNGHYEI